MIDAARRAGLTPVEEVFADRGYMPDGSLVPRSQPGALIESEEQSLAQTLSLVRDHRVTAIDGSNGGGQCPDRVPARRRRACAGLCARIRERLQARGVAAVRAMT